VPHAPNLGRNQGWKNLDFLERVFRFVGLLKVLMYEDQTQNYDPEIHEESYT